MTAMMLSNCVSNKDIGTCEIKEVLEFKVKNKDIYYANIIFCHCKSRELRRTLIKNELYNRYPSVKGKKIQINEYLGKLYNQYKYEIKIEW